MHSANNNGIKILGAAILRFSGRSKPGQTIETRQIVYVTSDSDKLFLSREACMALGMISENFSTVGEAYHVPETTTQAHPTTLPGHRGQQEAPATVAPGLLQIQHIQHL